MEQRVLVATGGAHLEVGYIVEEACRVCGSELGCPRVKVQLDAGRRVVVSRCQVAPFLVPDTVDDILTLG